MKDKNTEVLIIGAGPSGLTLSALLAQQGVKNIVIDKKPATQKFPAAHVLRPYSMNIFSSIGAAEILTPLLESFSIRFGSFGA